MINSKEFIFSEMLIFTMDCGGRVDKRIWIERKKIEDKVMDRGRNG